MPPIHHPPPHRAESICCTLLTGPILLTPPPHHHSATPPPPLLLPPPPPPHHHHTNTHIRTLPPYRIESVCRVLLADLELCAKHMLHLIGKQSKVFDGLLWIFCIFVWPILLLLLLLALHHCLSDNLCSQQAGRSGGKWQDVGVKYLVGRCVLQVVSTTGFKGPFWAILLLLLLLALHNSLGNNLSAKEVLGRMWWCGWWMGLRIGLQV